MNDAKTAFPLSKIENKFVQIMIFCRMRDKQKWI